MLQIYIESYGCSNNQAETEMIRAILFSAGCSFTNNIKIADIVIINTCIVKDKTINKIKRKIQDYSKKFDKGKRIIITGCMPETLLKDIINLSPNCSVISTHHIKKINIAVLNILKGKRTVLVGKSKIVKCSMPRLRENRLISIIPISSGCDGQCSYCLARLAKGALFSYDMTDIIKSIENDLKSGAKEIWITSQDNANYGMDKFAFKENLNLSISSENNSLINSSAKRSIEENHYRNQQLPELLNKILALKHNFKLRLGMMDPNNVLPILEELIRVYRNPKIYKFLHIPIQSASNKVLKDMNRLYVIEDVENIIERFRKEFPDITISTDIIVGYPTETQEDHEKNLVFIKKYKPPVFNLSKMSIHRGTPASKFKPINPLIMSKRASELMEIHRQTALENKKKFLGKTINVFVNMKKQGFYEARDENYNIVLLNTTSNLLGKNVKVKIKNIGVHHMLADLI